MKNGEGMSQALGRAWPSVSNPFDKTSEEDGHTRLSAPRKVNFSVSPCYDFMFTKQSYSDLASHVV